jgi:glycosyltransferase involved in cell wall biosynthesis
MRITFLLGGIELGGGVKLVLEFANRLQDKGHHVSVVYPIIPLRNGAKWYSLRKAAWQVLGSLENLKRGNRVCWFSFRAKLLRVPTLSQRFIPDADIVIATEWNTAYYVASYINKKGVKFHLIQHHEIWGGPKKMVENVYSLRTRKLVVSTWLKRLLENDYSVTADILFPGVYFDMFFPEKSRTYGGKRVLMAYRREKWKGIDDGLKAWEIVKKAVPDAQLVMFGVHKGINIPEYVEFHKFPSDEELRAIYNSCDVFLFPSHTEGLPAPPKEAMACGCALVSTKIDAAIDYAVSGETALLSPVGDYNALARNVITLLEDQEKLKQIAKNGLNFIRRFTWETVVDQLEKILLSSIEE